jgi:hypothetical protein
LIEKRNVTACVEEYGRIGDFFQSFRILRIIDREEDGSVFSISCSSFS